MAITRRLVALCDLVTTVGKQAVRSGDVFDALAIDAALLVHHHKAKYAPPGASTSPAAARSQFDALRANGVLVEAQPEYIVPLRQLASIAPEAGRATAQLSHDATSKPKRRRYQRRDLKASE
jgi:hypothetical protein